MKKGLSAIAMALFLCALCPASAQASGELTPSPVPDKTIVEIKDNRYYVIKTYERTLDTDEPDPSVLKEEPFILDGYHYAFFDLQKEAVPVVERKYVTEKAELVTETNDMTAILPQLAPDMAYEAEDFYGTLVLDHASIKTIVNEYQAKSFTLTDAQTFNGLSSADPITIPKSLVKSGVTLKLINVDWTVQETMSIGMDTVPSKYSAVAQYSGSYSKNMPVSYITTAEYKGEVGKSEIGKIVYTVTYLGEAIASVGDGVSASTDTTANAQADGILNDGTGNVNSSSRPDSTAFGWIVVLIGLLLAGGGTSAFIILRKNVYIYAKEGEVHRIAARRYVKWEDPVVDLRNISLPTTEAAVFVKQKLADKLFGRHITTIINDEREIKGLVDTQGADFWYYVSLSVDKSDEKTEIEIESKPKTESEIEEETK